MDLRRRQFDFCQIGWTSKWTEIPKKRPGTVRKLCKNNRVTHGSRRFVAGYEMEQCRGLRTDFLILYGSIISDPSKKGVGKGAKYGLGRRRKFVRCALLLSGRSEWGRMQECKTELSWAEHWCCCKYQQLGGHSKVQQEFFCLVIHSAIV